MILVNTNKNYLILLMLLNIFCMNAQKSGRVILIGGNQSKIIKKNLSFSCVCRKLLITLCN